MMAGAKIQAGIRLPRVPKRLTVEVGRGRGTALPLADFTDDELREVGTDYGAALVAEAKRQRMADSEEATETEEDAGD